METKNILTALRQSDPATCQKIWDAIKHIQNEKKIATVENIVRFVNKNYNLAGKNVERELPRLVHDGLLVEKKAITMKGSQKGAEQSIYSIPASSEMNLKSSHDWYCFECHKPGEVLLCTKCPRVYHVHCLSQENSSMDNFICHYCQDCEINEIPSLERCEVNMLLSFVVSRLEDNYSMDFYAWNPSLTFAIYASSFSTDRCATLAQKKQKVNADSTGETDSWRVKYLLRLEVDLPKMNSRADRQVYRNFAQFRLDAQTLVHNVSVYHGEHSPTADSARSLLRKCLKELDEIKLCTDCYRRSNLQENPNWFCEPCDPPHQLVFAKAKSYPFWPAKVMGIVGDKYDVRFFGGAHDRSKIDKWFIRPIDSNVNELVTKRSAAWYNAMKELELHQKMVAEDLLSDEDYNMIDDSEALGEPSQNPVLPSTSSEAISTPERITLMKDVRVTVKRIEEDPAVKKLASNIQERRAAEDVVNTSFDDPLGSLGTQSETPAFHEQVSLDQVLQQFKDDEFRSTLETVNELKKEIEFLKETHSSEIMSLKDEIGRLMIERDQAIADAKDRAEQITAIKHQYEEQMKSTKERFEEELANVTTEKKGQIESVERDCEQKIEEIRNEHQETLQSIEAMYKVQIDVMESEGKKLAEKKVDDIRVEYEKNIEEIKKEYQERMESMETHYKEKVEATKKEGKEQINREVEGVREEYTQQIQTLKQGHEEQIQLIREECQRDIHTNKKKQWCAQCGNEGLLHCCLAVSYCNTDCQLLHWNTAHKKFCLRKKEKQEQKKEVSS